MAIGQVFVALYGFVWLFAIIMIAVAVKRKRDAQGGQRISRPAAASKPKPARQSFKTLGKAEPKPLKESMAFMEDRRHDWLAQQLREEYRLAQKSDIFGTSLKGKDGNARGLKMMHILEHDNSVDDGEI
ncbi:MAG: hypothetical protein IK069_00785 [Firmicutes bacterium]|nr:hypothetical protein [Bacillota bacterium]